MELDKAAIAQGVGLIACDEIDSTNAEALRRARSGESGPLWVTARTQYAGRGRRGRTWASAAGNLYASLLLTDPSLPDLAPQLSFVAALALHDAIVEVAAGIEPRLSLKWPNDVLCGDKKVAGILVEGEGTRPFSVVIGIGVNCGQHPDETEFPATDLASAGMAVTPDVLFPGLSATTLLRLVEWDRGLGFSSIRTEWLKRASGIGRDICVRVTERELTGCFTALDAHGRLLLTLSNGDVEIISAGDVFPLGTPNRASEAQAQMQDAMAAPDAPARTQHVGARGRASDRNA
jgi:BirA family biotin operon repressor/biotin-[acetyl-CoA-carboxylase] ligase